MIALSCIEPVQKGSVQLSQQVLYAQLLHGSSVPKSPPAKLLPVSVAECFI
jgi:hypothetical protein